MRLIDALVYGVLMLPSAVTWSQESNCDWGNPTGSEVLKSFTGPCIGGKANGQGDLIYRVSNSGGGSTLYHQSGTWSAGQFREGRMFVGANGSSYQYFDGTFESGRMVGGIFVDSRTWPQGLEARTPGRSVQCRLQSSGQMDCGVMRIQKPTVDQIRSDFARMRQITFASAAVNQPSLTPNNPIPSTSATQVTATEVQQSQQAQVETIPLPGESALLFLGKSSRYRQVTFWQHQQFGKPRCTWSEYVFGLVPNDISLADDAIARALIVEADRVMRTVCGLKSSDGILRITLVPQKFQTTGVWPNPQLVRSTTSGCNEQSCRSWDDKINNNYINYALAEARKAQQQAQLRVQQNEATNRRGQFTQQHGISAWPPMDELSANPFQYEGKVVGLRARFLEMITASSGRFVHIDSASGLNYRDVYVSSIPKGIFTRTSQVVLAAKVVGKSPMGSSSKGERLVTHVEFKGVHFCRDEDCTDFNTK